MFRLFKAFSVLSLLLAGCKSKLPAGGELHFTLMNSSATGIDFNNQITESDSIHVFENEYMYNGSGVGIGDFNNDGLADVFMGGSMVESKLYLNKGNMRFEDITTKAGIQTDQWITGVSVVDINNDGFQDIYLCSSHAHDPSRRRNQLYINDGKLHFSEQAKAYGLADESFSTQAAFLDYDRDGDLDMYLLNHRLYDNTANNLAPKDTSGQSPAQDKLYRNEGVVGGHPVFRDVTLDAGIKEDGYGLGIVVSDFDQDGWPDVYAGNDYIANDLLWMNQGNGRFNNRIATAIRHQSYNSMGTDAADINNDGLPDIASLDMTPENNERKKMMFTVFSQEKFELQQRMGYEPAYMRNMLQLNNGVRTAGNRKEPFFSEIGQLAGIAETDWSWSILFADFDNDGWKDAHITNGLAKDVTNNDFTTFKNEQTTTGYSFGGGASKPDQQTLNLLRKNLDEYGSVKIDNYFFRNRGDLTFANETLQTGLSNPSVSNGAAYSDLDNDGDLDLVVNNMNQEAFVYRNDLRQNAADTSTYFLSLQLRGPDGNRDGLGAKLCLYQKTGIQVLEQFPVRGFSSSVDQRLHFGLGTLALVDSLVVTWPDGKVQTIRMPAANKMLEVRYADAAFREDAIRSETKALFSDAGADLHLGFGHSEMMFYDYGAQRGLLQKYSQLGPCLAAADVNGDGREDFFVGGAAFQPGKLFYQLPDGSFRSRDLVTGSKPEEDVEALFLDAEGDGDADLVVSGGSVEFPEGSANNQLRLYLNDGKGKFTRNDAALPRELSLISKALSAADYDGDGDVDLFVGGYVVPQHYPRASRSYLLENKGGVFTDVTASVGAALLNPGLVTDAVWTDINQDRRPDLVICGEWMPVRCFVNKAGKLTEQASGMNTGRGLWRTLHSADLDGDGDQDLVAGNIGQNNRYHLSAERPLRLFAKDVDNNGTEDIIPAYYLKNASGSFQLFPDADRNQLADRFPVIKKKYLRHQDFATVTMEQVLEDYGKEGWTMAGCEQAASVWIENLGAGRWTVHQLPVEAQMAPINAIVSGDFNGDGRTDLILAGNEYEAEAMIGRYDASYGSVLLRTSKSSLQPLPFSKSGLALEGDIKDLLWVNGKDQGGLLIAAPNNEVLQVFAREPSRGARDISPAGKAWIQKNPGLKK